MKARLLRVLCALCVGIVVQTGCTVSSRPTLPIADLQTPAVLPTPVPDGENAPLQPPDAANGASIYEEKCAACHGATGAGDGPSAEQIRAQGKVVANLVDDARRRAAKPGDWHTVITNGRIQNLMPPFSGSLNAQQRWDAQAHVWSLAVPSQTLTAGQTVYAAQCAGCHGASGETRVGDAQLAFNDPRFLADRSLLDIAGGMARGAPHANLAIGDADRLALAEAVRAFGYRYSDPTKADETRVQGDGVIRLQAMNATTSTVAPANLPVTLRVYDAASEVLTRTAPIDAAGVVTFTDLPTRTDYFFQAEVDYEGGRFYGPPLQFPITVTAPLTEVLAVYETITDSAQISIGEMHFFVQSINEGTATIVEFYQFDNGSDRAYVGDSPERRTLKLSMPEGAQNLRFDGLGLGKRFFQDGEVLWDTDVVVPGGGAQRVTMIYDVPYRGGRTFERQVFYPVKSWDVILPETTGPGTPLQVRGLTDRGVQQMESGNVLLYAGNATQTERALRWELTGQPLGAAQAGADGRAIGFGLIAFGVTVGLAYFLFNRVRAIRATFGVLPQQRKGLLHQIAGLDDDFAQGKLKERDYRRQRERLKDELKEVWD